MIPFSKQDRAHSRAWSARDHVSFHLQDEEVEKPKKYGFTPKVYYGLPTTPATPGHKPPPIRPSPKPPSTPSPGSYFADDSPPQKAGRRPFSGDSYFETELQQHFDPIDKRPRPGYEDAYRLPDGTDNSHYGLKDPPPGNPQQGAKDEL